MVFEKTGGRRRKKVMKKKKFYQGKKSYEEIFLHFSRVFFVFLCFLFVMLAGYLGSWTPGARFPERLGTRKL